MSDWPTHPPGVAAEDLLAAVLQTLAQPVWVVDRDGRIRFATADGRAVFRAEGAPSLPQALSALALAVG